MNKYINDHKKLTPYKLGINNDKITDLSAIRMSQNDIDSMDETQRHSLLLDLRHHIKSEFKTNKTIDAFIFEILILHGLEKGQVLRRSYDGNSEVSWLIEKMIGEFLINGDVNL